MPWDVVGGLLAAIVTTSQAIRHPRWHSLLVASEYLLAALLAYAATGLAPALIVVAGCGVAVSALLSAYGSEEVGPVGAIDMLQWVGSLLVTVFVAYGLTRTFDLTGRAWLDGTMVWIGVASILRLVQTARPSLRARGLCGLMLTTLLAYWTLSPQADLVGISGVALLDIAVVAALIVRSE